MVERSHRTSYRGWLGALMAASGLALGLSACGRHDVCRSGDSTPECTDEAGGIRFITTCEAADRSGLQACLTVSEGRTLDVLCGEASSPLDCAVGDDARKTTGITEDTTGILLDQGSGTLTLNLDAFASSELESGLRIEILAASVGDGPAELDATLGPCADCPAPTSITVNQDYAWIEVTRLPQPGAPRTLALSGAGIEIADIRMKVATTRISSSRSILDGSPSCGLQ